MANDKYLLGTEAVRSQAEVARILGIAKAQVWQTEQRALKKIRRYLVAKWKAEGREYHLTRGS